MKYLLLLLFNVYAHSDFTVAIAIPEDRIEDVFDISQSIDMHIDITENCLVFSVKDAIEGYRRAQWIQEIVGLQLDWVSLVGYGKESEAISFLSYRKRSGQYRLINSCRTALEDDRPTLKELK